MDFYEKLKKICNEHGTTVSGLEKTLGFSNASLSKGTPRADRLYKIAEYFDLPNGVKSVANEAIEKP